MRNLNAGVLIPLVLSFAIGVLIYLYGTSRSQHKSLLENFRDVQRTASNLRSERDSLQYDLNKAKDESQQTLKEKEKALERAMVAEDKANRANDDLEELRSSFNSLQSEFNKLKEADTDLQDNRDKAKADLAAFTSKWKQCEAGKKELIDSANLRASEHSAELDRLRHDVAQASELKTDVERKLNELEQYLRACENSLLSERAAEKAAQQVPKVAVDDRSIELVPPEHLPDGEVQDGGVANGNDDVMGNPINDAPEQANA